MGQQVPADPAVLRAEIARTRSDLGETVAALAAKTDVKARAKGALSEAADNVRRSVSDRANSVRASLDGSKLPVSARKPLPIAAGALVGASVGGLVYAIMRRRGR